MRACAHGSAWMACMHHLKCDRVSFCVELKITPKIAVCVGPDCVVVVNVVVGYEMKLMRSPYVSIKRAVLLLLVLLHIVRRHQQVHVYIVKNHCISIIDAVRVYRKAFLPTKHTTMLPNRIWRARSCDVLSCMCC